MRRGLLLGLVAALACLMLPATVVGAEPCSSPFDGSMSFQNIQGPDDPQDYCWEVKLGEDQALRQINDREAEVYTTDSEEHHNFSITAVQAHDAEGVSVPTTLAVTEPNLITLTVHHRAGNPLAGGAPFYYPVVAGAGWEGGFQTVRVEMLPPTEQGMNTPPAAPTCAVPYLQGRTLKAARQALRRAGCSLGPIRGHRSGSARIVKQYRPANKVLPAGSAVGVKLAR